MKEEAREAKQAVREAKSKVKEAKARAREMKREAQRKRREKRRRRRETRTGAAAAAKVPDMVACAGTRKAADGETEEDQEDGQVPASG